MRHLFFVFAYPAILVSVLSSVGCKKTNQQPDQSDVKVTSGNDVSKYSDETRVIVGLIGVGADKNVCTGTLLNESTVLTAAHCVFDPDDKVTGGIIVDRIGSPVRVFMHPEYLEKTAMIAQMRAVKAKAPLSERNKHTTAINHAFLNELLPVDLALVVVERLTPERLADLKITRFYGVSTQKTYQGATAYILGYGSDELGSNGINVKSVGRLREGLARVEQVNDKFLQVIGFGSPQAAQTGNFSPGFRVSIAPGDSGGPWIVCTREDQLGKGKCSSFRLMAISQGAEAGDADAKGYGTLLQTEKALSFFKASIQCGGINCAQNFAGSGVTR